VGGTTPSAGTIKTAKKYLNIPVMVLIRPRGGNFVYSSEEIEVMKSDIALCKQLGVDGIVIGALKPNAIIDIELTKEFIEQARPMKITFHKAIDETRDILDEFKHLLQLDIDRLLTSGGRKSAIEGLQTINEMCALGRGKIEIVVAGKITKSNLKEHQALIHSSEFHGKLIVGPLE
jgi:copper homeostasis protein